MVAGIAGEWLAASHVGVNGSPWPVVPGLVVSGAGLALLVIPLVIPLVNVVLAAVPVEVAGGASGLFGTAQQLGGALGVAVFGTVFLRVPEPALVPGRDRAHRAVRNGRVRGVRGAGPAAPPHGGVGGGAAARILRGSNLKAVSQRVRSAQ
jgi:hypothetical protein